MFQETARKASTVALAGFSKVEKIDKTLPEIGNTPALLEQVAASTLERELPGSGMFSASAWEVLRHRYLRCDEQGRVIETPEEIFTRVARTVAEVEADYHGNVTEWEENFYRLMVSLQFLPNSPTLMNVGTSSGQCAACFVLPIEDSLESIFQAVKDMALIHQSRGGTGFSLSRLRPCGDPVASTGRVASGPVSFSHIFDVATEVVKQEGRGRGANMAVLRVDHPDIVEFMRARRSEKAFCHKSGPVARDSCPHASCFSATH